MEREKNNTISGLVIPRGLKFVLEKITRAGFKPFLVGGCLRDHLLKRVCKDWDIAVNAPTEAIIPLFKRVVPVGIEKGCVCVIHNRVMYEVSSFRSARAGCLGKNIKEDLSHRDFTINALAYDPLKGEVLDPFQGAEDLGKKIIRAVGDPKKRFKEDPLRTLRAIRLASLIGFRIQNDTLRAINEFEQRVKALPQERVRGELMKILTTRCPSISIDLMRRTGLLAAVLPELLLGYRMKQNARFHAYDVYKHTLLTVDALPPDPVLRVAGLLHDIGKPASRKKINREFKFFGHEKVGEEISDTILKRLRFSNAERKRITHLVRHHLLSYAEDWKDSAVKRLMARLGEKNLKEFFLLIEADKKAKGKGLGNSPDIGHLKKRIKEILSRREPLTISDLTVNGNDVILILGIEPGKKVGAVLQKLLDVVLKDPTKNRRNTLQGILSRYSEFPL